MGRPKLKRPNCQLCGRELKSLRATLCGSCAGAANNRKRATRSLAERFWSKVSIPDNPDNCWEWVGAICQSTGYGVIGLGSRLAGTETAHRASYLLTYEFVPDGDVICHHCDNRKCVNPAHLYAGSYSDNLNDAWKRSRKRAA